MEINYLAIVVASVLQFIFGAIWYMPIFGDVWGKIHGFDRQTPEAQEAMQKGMATPLVIQIVMTLLTTFVFAIIAPGFPASWNIFGLAGFFWLGFIVPTQVAAVIFGGTDQKWVAKKCLIMIGASFGCFQIIAGTFHFMW